MKLTWYLLRREIRHRWKHLLPFWLIAASLIFTAAAQVTFQESANSTVSPVDYMASPSYMILFGAFALIGFTAAKTCFTLYSEKQLSETGTLRALGMRKRDVRRIPVFLGLFCMLTASAAAVPLAFLYIFIFVSICTSGDMTLTTFVPLVFRIPFVNVLITLGVNWAAMLLGILTGYSREKSIVSLIRRGKEPLEAETGSGNLPEEGTLRDYGRLYVRRSVKRCIRYNLVTAMLLILPMIFILGAATYKQDFSTHTFALHRTFNHELREFPEITDEMFAEVNRIPGVERTEGRIPMKQGYGTGYHTILVYTEKGADMPALREQIERFCDDNTMKFEDSAVIRSEENKINRCYFLFFLFEAAVLFLTGCITSFSLLKSRLTTRKRELSVLRAIGAGAEEILSAVIPETVADYSAGALLSVAAGAFGFCGILSDGDGMLNIPALIVPCFVFLAFCLFVQIRASRRMTADILSEADIRL